MIELDYAFLADYAAIQESKLTAVGASFTRMVVREMPSQVMLSVAGRVRVSTDIDEVNLAVRATAPHQSYQLDGTLRISDLKDLPEYGEGKRGAVFALQFSLPLMEFGTYVIEVDILETEEVDRVLKFEAVSL